MHLVLPTEEKDMLYIGTLVYEPGRISGFVFLRFSTIAKNLQNMHSVFCKSLQWVLCKHV